MNSIFKRQSVRKYTDKKISEEQVEKLLDAGMMAPSAWNQQSWEFIVVDDRNVLDTLSEVTPYATPLKSATLAIVVLANKSTMSVEEYWQQDLAASCENILLEAVELGLGGVWLGIAPKEDRMAKLSQMFNLPENILPFSIISLGYPEKDAVSRSNYDKKKVHYNKY